MHKNVFILKIFCEVITIKTSLPVLNMRMLNADCVSSSSNFYRKIFFFLLLIEIKAFIHTTPHGVIQVHCYILSMRHI